MRERNLNIFLNCPYDSAYKDLFFASVFAILACGHTPRCALESLDSSENRLDKIIGLIRVSQYAIHDISRVELSRNGYPRFNMPFELGLWIGASKATTLKQRRPFLVLDSEAYRYREFISDLSGIDIQTHSSDPEMLITRVRDFLQALAPEPLPGPKQLQRLYQLLREDWSDLCRFSGLEADSASFRDISHLIHKWLLARTYEGRA